MPIGTLFAALFTGFISVGMVFNAIEECAIYWLPAIFFGFWSVVKFLEFFAMC